MKRMIVVAVLLFLAVAGPARAQAAPTFFYVVTAVDANGFESVFSTQASATLTQGTKTVTLTWTAPAVPAGGAAIVGYNVYRSQTSGGAYAKITAAPVTGGTTFADPFVAPNAPSGLTTKVS